MKRKHAVFAAGAVLAIGLLAGCGKETQEAGQNQGSAAPVSSEPIELNIGGAAA